MCHRLRVLVINRVGFLGGVERVILSIEAAAREGGFVTTLACPPGELVVAAARQGIDVADVAIDRSRRTLSPLGLARLGLAMRRGQRDVTSLAGRIGANILHAHHPIGGLYAAQAARVLGVPLILHVHETLPASLLYAFALRRVMPHCSRFVCVSDSSAALMHRMGAPPGRVQRLYNGVDPGFTQAASEVPELCGPGPHIGHFGVLEPRKGQDVFIAAAARLARSHPGAQFWIVGALTFAENRPYLVRLQAEAASAGLAGRVHFVGHRTNVRDWMAGMDAIVLASREKESLPTVLIEGAMLGRPLVATDVGGVREIIEDGSTGLVVPPGAADLLAAAIGRVLGEEGQMFGARAKADAAHRFSSSRFGADIAALYKEFAPGRAGGAMKVAAL